MTNFAKETGSKIAGLVLPELPNLGQAAGAAVGGLFGNPIIGSALGHQAGTGVQELISSFL